MIDIEILAKEFANGANIESLKLPLDIFIENGITIAYCKDIDLAGYGQNEDEARLSFNIVLVETFNHILETNPI